MKRKIFLLSCLANRSLTGDGPDYMIVSLMVYSTPSMPLVTYCSILIYTATDKPLIPGLNRFQPGISNSTLDVSMHWYSACARGPSMCELLEKIARRLRQPLFYGFASSFVVPVAACLALTASTICLTASGGSMGAKGAIVPRRPPAQKTATPACFVCAQNTQFLLYLSY